MGASYIQGILVTLLCILSSVLGVFVSRRYVKSKSSVPHPEIIGAMLQVVGTLYAILLGLVVIDSMHVHDDARTLVQQEANCLVDIFHLSKGLPSDETRKMQRWCVAYAEAVLDHEWREMEKKRQSERTGLLVTGVWRDVMSIEPKTEREKNAYSLMVNEIRELGNNRRMRLLTSQRNVHPALWGVLVIGGFCTVVLSYFFFFESLGVQLFITVLMASTLALNVFLVSMYNYPFSGDIRVKADPFKFVLKIFQNEMSAQNPDKVDRGLDFEDD